MSNSELHRASAPEAMEATIAWEPSPPAIPTTSAPEDTAPAASATRSSSSFITTGSIPRPRHRVTRSSCWALPPPDVGLMRRTGCAGEVDT